MRRNKNHTSGTLIIIIALITGRLHTLQLLSLSEGALSGVLGVLLPPSKDEHLDESAALTLLQA